MIARIWHGRPLGHLGDEYLEYIIKSGIQGYKATEGNRGVYGYEIAEILCEQLELEL